jgi:hypothetical protein
MFDVVCAVVRSSFGVGAIGSLLAVNFALPATAHSLAHSASPQTYQYPESVVQVYVEACGGAATDRVSQPIMHSICVCTIEEFQNTFSLREFQRLSQLLKAGQETPAAMERIMGDCVRQVMLRPDV